METTAPIYLHDDVSIKERALERTRPLHAKPGRFRPPDPGALLRRRRAELGLSGRQVAEALGIPGPTDVTSRDSH